MPPKQPIRQPAPQHRIIQKRIIRRRRRIPIEPILQIRRNGNLILLIRRQRLDGIPQSLVEEKLRQVRDLAARVRPVRQQLRPDVRDDVLVRGAPFVVAGEDGVEADDAVGVGGLHAAEVCGGEPALAGGADAAVGAGRVAGPDVDEHVGGLAGGDVDELEFKVEGNAGDAFRYVLSD